MKIKEKGLKIKMTEDIRSYLYKKLKHLEKFLDPKDESILCEVDLGKITKHHKHGDIFKTEINLRMSGKSLRAVSKMDDLFASIDVAKDEMVRELELYKDKKVSQLKKGGAKVKSLKKDLSK